MSRVEIVIVIVIFVCTAVRLEIREILRAENQRIIVTARFDRIKHLVNVIGLRSHREEGGSVGVDTNGGGTLLNHP